MSKIWLLLAPVLLLTGCDPIEGLIQVTKRIDYKFVNTDPKCNNMDTWDFSCDQSTVTSIEPGSHRLEITQDNKWSLRIEIKAGNARHVISFDTKKKTIPSDGRFVLSSSESGQPFDVVADLKTTITDGPLQHTNDRCTETHSHGERCYLIPGRPGTPAINRCVETIDHYEGDRDLEFFNRNTHLALAGVLTKQGDQLANMNGSRSDNERIITYDSGCKNTRFVWSEDITRDRRP